MSQENIIQFIESTAESIRNRTFVKMSLGNYKGEDRHLQKILVRLIKTKKGIRLFFLFRYETRDTAKNFKQTEGLKRIQEMLGTEFFSGHLFTTEKNLQLDIGKKGRSRLNRGKPTFTSAPDLEHDRAKNTLIDPNSFYLKALGITTDRGRIRSRQHDKWKQINRFVETLKNLIENSELSENKRIAILDMGCGKGYLTFAAYDYFANTRGIKTSLTGVDKRPELVSLCNDIAKSANFEGLEFVEGEINSYEPSSPDVLIALHACNVATDEAIFKGISKSAKLIVVAPCCHQEVRPQIKAPDLLKGVLKHGAVLDREAETITDGLRSILMESRGYETRIFEFISNEHTPKNNMIVGNLSSRTDIDASEFTTQAEDLMKFYGIENQRLATLLLNREKRAKS